VRSATQKTASTTQTPATEAEATPPTPSQRVSLLDIYMGKSQDK
jgi:hypothetical protein